MDGQVEYRQVVITCNNSQCRRCCRGIGHGPYWYAYRTENGRTTRTYIGKNLPKTPQETHPYAMVGSDLSQNVLRIRALGQFLLERRSGQEWKVATEAVWRHHRPRTLFVCLLSSPGRTMGKEQVIDALWPEADVEAGFAHLDRAVYSLRRVLEPELGRPAASQFLRFEHEVLFLADQSALWVDADAFEHLLSEARTTRDPGRAEKLLEKALALYKGNYLPGERDVDWVMRRREALQRDWTGLLLELADLQMARGAFAAALGPLERLLASDPTNEAAVQRLLVSLAHEGRRVEALRAYQRFADALWRDHQVVPLPQTQAFYAAVRQETVL